MNWPNRKQFRIGLPATTKNWLTLFGRANWKSHFKLQLNSNSLNSQLIWSALVVVKALNDLNNWTLWWARSDGGAKLWDRWINWPSGGYAARAVCDKGASLSLSRSLTLSYTSGGNVAIKNEESELIQLCALRKSTLLIPLQSVYKS